MNINTKRTMPILLSAAVAMSISGCAEKRSCNSIATAKLPTKVKVADDRDKQINALQVAIVEAKSRKGGVTTKVVNIASADSIYPPNAQPGKCYKKVLIPAKFKSVTEKVLASEASQSVSIVPATYTTVTKKILAKEASTRLIAVPATYKKITQKVLVSESSERLVKIPAKYTTQTEKIQISEATTNWKKANCAGGDCGTMCLVETPARYKTVTRKVVAQPATTKSVPIPAQYKTVTRTVLDQPATTKSIPVPAVYKTVTIKQLVNPASVKTTAIPESYKTVTRRVQVSPSSLKWVESSCKSVRTSSVQSAPASTAVASAPASSTSTGKVNVRDLQIALRDSGINPGPIDGIFGRKTRAALIKYQNSNGLVAGKLTRDTLSSLGMM